MEISNKIMKHNIAVAALQEMRFYNALFWKRNGVVLSDQKTEKENHKI